ncbi:MAG: hypothetical protein IT192_01295 [Microbacteriaceae bacterium]|nr:hypothetical protein [Microbacteriaceae bacterium]
MRLRSALIPLGLILALAGCTPAAPPTGPAASPSGDSSPSASADPSPSPAALQLPASCDALVPLATIREQLGSAFVAQPLDLSTADPEATDFAERGGLTCLWVIPNSGGGVMVFVAERAAPSDEYLTNQWTDLGMSECPPFLDACYWQDDSGETGGYYTVRTLVEGFEMRISGSAGSIDPLMVIARAAATSLGYV